MDSYFGHLCKRIIGYLTRFVCNPFPPAGRIQTGH